jgi:hypothetical protein
MYIYILCENIIKKNYKTPEYKFINIILIVFVDGISAGRKMKYRPHPQTSFGGTFTSILIPTGKNSQTSDLQTGQSPRESPFTGEIDIPILGYLTKKKEILS